MKASILAVAGFLFSTAAMAAPEWDIGENFVGGGVVGAEWTISQDFPGTKIIFDTQYSFVRRLGEPPEDDCCGIVPQAEYYWAMLDSHLQWGIGQTGLEYAILGVSTWGAQWEPKFNPDKKLQVLRDQVKLGRFKLGFDNPLGIDDYNELDLVRFDRTWVYKSTPDSAFAVKMGMGLSAGWAWASSINPAYKDVSNPTTGFLVNLTVDIPVFGALYSDDRIVQGYTLGSPADNSSTSREARIRFGYFRRLPLCLAIDAFIEKRSFNFADPVMPDLYSKSKRYGAELSCQFGKT